MLWIDALDLQYCVRILQKQIPIIIETFMCNYATEKSQSNVDFVRMREQAGEVGEEAGWVEAYTECAHLHRLNDDIENLPRFDALCSR